MDKQPNFDKMIEFQMQRAFKFKNWVTPGIVTYLLAKEVVFARIKPSRISCYLRPSKNQQDILICDF